MTNMTTRNRMIERMAGGLSQEGIRQKQLREQPFPSSHYHDPYPSQPESQKPLFEMPKTRMEQGKYNTPQFIYDDLSKLVNKIGHKYPYMEPDTEKIKKDIEAKGYSRVVHKRSEGISLSIYIKKISEGYWAGETASSPDEHINGDLIFHPVGLVSLRSSAAITVRLDRIASELEKIDPRIALAIDKVSDKLAGDPYEDSRPEPMDEITKADLEMMASTFQHADKIWGMIKGKTPIEQWRIMWQEVRKSPTTAGLEKQASLQELQDKLEALDLTPQDGRADTVSLILENPDKTLVGQIAIMFGVSAEQVIQAAKKAKEKFWAHR